MSSDLIDRIRNDFPASAARMDAVPQQLAPGWLMAAASRSVGLDDFGPDIYADPLDRVCRSANDDANLNPLGRMILAQTIITQLESRALMQRRRQQNAPQLRSALIPPIIVTGLPRTGTTALHRLLATDPDHAALPYWQLNRPISRGPGDSDVARAFGDYETRFLSASWSVSRLTGFTYSPDRANATRSKVFCQRAGLLQNFPGPKKCKRP